MRLIWQNYIPLWFRKDWWQYLLTGVRFYDRSEKYWFFQHIHCRATGHKPGVVWYNPSGLEPDYTCRGCGDDLG